MQLASINLRKNNAINKKITHIRVMSTTPTLNSNNTTAPFSGSLCFLSAPYFHGSVWQCAHCNSFCELGQGGGVAGLVGPGAGPALLRGTGVSVLVVKPAVVGGAEATLRLAAWAHAQGLQVGLLPRPPVPRQPPALVLIATGQSMHRTCLHYLSLIPSVILH